ncbi:hypothetical protein SESBI_28826 [Sesbania bispinosa]|nr:hypothetical protein SESBI_28826 [Sesbania bispinosa]
MSHAMKSRGHAWSHISNLLPPWSFYSSVVRRRGDPRCWGNERQRLHYTVTRRWSLCRNKNENSGCVMLP